MTNPHSDNLDLELVAKDPKQLERLVSNFKTYVLAFESSPLPFALFDKDHRIRRWNKAYEKLHGWLFDNHREEIESGKFRYEDFVRLSAPKELEGEALEEYVHNRLSAQKDATGNWTECEYADSGWFRVIKFPLDRGSIAGIGFDINDLKQREDELRIAKAEAETAQRAFQEAISVLDDGFVIFDENDRLLVCNDAFREQFGDGQVYIREGATYREMTLDLAHSGIIPNIEGREEEFVDDLVEKRKSEEGYSNIFQRHDGKWIRQRDKRTRTGHLVGVRTDITELKEQEKETRDHHALMTSVLSSSENGILVTENYDRAVVFNQAFVDYFKIPKETLDEASTYRDLIDCMFEFKAFADFTVDGISKETFISKGMEISKKAGERPQTLILADGRRLRYKTRQMDGGLIVHSYVDITEEREQFEALAKTHRELELTKNRLQKSNDAMAQGLIVFEKGRVAMFNQKAMDILVLDADILFIGQTINGFLDAQLARERFGDRKSGEAFIKNHKLFIAKGEPYNIERTTVDGRYLRVDGVPGEDGHLVLSFTDNTELHRSKIEFEQTSQRLQATTDAMAQGIIVFENYKVAMYNQRVLKIMEVDESILYVGQTLEGIYKGKLQQENGGMGPGQQMSSEKEELTKKFVQKHDELIKAGKRYQIERQTPNGRYIQIDGVPGENGNLILTLTDTTEIKKREIEFEKTSHLLTETTEAMVQGILVFGKEKIRFVNPEANRLLQVPPSVLSVGKPWRKLLEYQHARGDYGSGPESDEKLARVINQIETREAHHIERTTKDGRVLRADGSPSGDSGWIVTYMDITDTKAREKHLEVAIKKSEAAEKAKAEFLANMSHEIRTPMNGVMGMAELLATTNLDPKQKMFTDVIVKSGASLLTIINDILDFSKIDAGQMELDPAPFNLREAIEDVATLVSSKVAEKDLELIVRVDPQLPETVVGDVGRLRQIITNLMGNAVKFTEKGHVYINVNGSMIGEGAEATAKLNISVEDTGIGIPEEKCEHIFQKFSQVDASASRKHEGTGLGLAIASSLVGLMSGKISVVSKVGAGSTFWFEIELPVSEGSMNKKAVAGDLGGARILIVDDNEVNRSILTEQMNAWNFDSAAAASGPEGLEVMRAVKGHGMDIDLVILDYQMPDHSGADVLEMIRKDDALKDTPVLMLTSVDSIQANKRLDELGANGNLTKPTRSSLLFETINQIIGDQRLKSGQEGAASPKLTLVEDTGLQSDEPETQAVEYIVPAAPVSETHEAAEGSAQPAEQRLDILVAEDNEVNQIVVTQILEEARVSYRIVANGRLALESFRECQPRMILMDVSMPEMNGKQATRAIREYESENGLGRTPIVGVTAHALKGDMEDCLKAGMDDYLSKPVSPHKLVEKINAWLETEEAETASA